MSPENFFGPDVTGWKIMEMSLRNQTCESETGNENENKMTAIKRSYS